MTSAAPRRFSTWLAPALAALLAMLPYSGVLGADFVDLDDTSNIVRNLDFRGWTASSFAWMISTTHMGHYQPLTWFSYSLDYQLAGLSPTVFHATSVLLHGIATVLVYCLARSLFASFLRSSAPATGAFLAACAFGMHPLRAESVAWVTGRNDLLAGIFALAAAWAWIVRLRHMEESPTEQAPPNAPVGPLLLGSLAFVLLFFTSVEVSAAPMKLQGLGSWGLGLAAFAFSWTCRCCLRVMGTGAVRRLWILSLGTYGLSLTGKASAIALPAVLLVLSAWLPRLPVAAGRAPRPPWRARVLELLPFLLLTVVFGVLAAHAKAASWPVELSPGKATLGERLTQVAYGLGFYPFKTLVPTELLPLYQLPGELSLHEPRFLAGALGLPAVLLVLALAARKTRAPLLAWLAFALLISPALGFVPVGDQLVADRYSYVPCVPFALLIGGFAAKSSTAGDGARQSVWTTAGILLVLLAAMTSRQASHWRDTTSLYAYSAERSESPRLLTNFAMLRNAQAGQDPRNRSQLLTEALRLSDRAVAAAEAQQSSLPYLRLHRGTILYNLGRGQEALDELSRYVDQRPADPQGRYNLGLTLKLLGRVEEAQRYLQE